MQTSVLYLWHYASQQNISFYHSKQFPVTLRHHFHQALGMHCFANSCLCDVMRLPYFANIVLVLFAAVYQK